VAEADRWSSILFHKIEYLLVRPGEPSERTKKKEAKTSPPKPAKKAQSMPEKPEDFQQMTLF
jgi:hypothetical protein